MLSTLEHIAHRFGTQVRSNGVLCLCSNGDPALVRVFKELGWSDPQPIETIPVKATVREEAAVLLAPERAVLKAPKGRVA
jgi:hypothetical protein